MGDRSFAARLDESYPSVVRWVGLTLGVVLILAPVVSDISVAQVAGGYPLATGMIFFKTVRDAVNGGPR